MKSPTRQSKRKASRRGEVRARKAFGVYINDNLESLQMNPMPGDEWPLCPVFVLPADAESVERMIEQVADRLACYVYGDPIKELPEPYQKACREISTACLAALNLTPTKP